MPDVCEMVESVSDTVAPSVPAKTAEHLRPYWFQPGHAPTARAGRPKGVRNSQTILLASAPKLVKNYIKQALKDTLAATPLLVDARKWILPIETNSSSLSLTFGDTTLSVKLPLREVVSEELRVDETHTQARTASEPEGSGLVDVGGDGVRIGGPTPDRTPNEAPPCH